VWDCSPAGGLCAWRATILDGRSLMYRQWGGDLIDMSALPEAKLAHEAELS
jgi:hypothetical protein